MRHQATPAAAASLLGCATVLAIGHLLATFTPADISAEDLGLRRLFARAAALIAAPLQRCYAQEYAAASGGDAADRDQDMMLAGLACDGGLALSGAGA